MYFKGKFYVSPLCLGMTTDGPLEMDLAFRHGQKARALVHPRQTDSTKPALVLLFEMAVSPNLTEHIEEFDRKKGWPEEADARAQLSDFFESTAEYATDMATTVLQTLRWRCGEICTEPIRSRGMLWSKDSDDWRHFPPSKPRAIGVRILNEWKSEGIIPEVCELIEQGKRWPVAMEMWQEAWNMLPTARRSAVVLGIGALEVAVKEFVGHASPKARWLAMHSQSPPVLQMLCEYLPALSCRSTKPPKHIRKLLDKGIRLRNEIVHRGADVHSVEDVVRLLEAVEETIWLLEWSKGFDRAWYFISPKTLREYLRESAMAAINEAKELTDVEKNRIKNLIPDLLDKTDRSQAAIDYLAEVKDKLSDRAAMLLRCMIPRTSGVILPASGRGRMD